MRALTLVLLVGCARGPFDPEPSLMAARAGCTAVQVLGSFADDPSSLTGVRRFEFVHDDHGVVITESELRAGTPALIVRRTADKGLVSRVEMLDGNGGVLSVAEIEHERGKPVLEVLRGPDGSEYYTIVRDFDGKGNQLEETISTAGEVTSSRVYTYDGRGRVLTETVDSNLREGTTTYTYERQGRGWQQTSSDGVVAEFDAQGRMRLQEGPSPLGGSLALQREERVWGDDHELVSSTISQLDDSGAVQRQTTQESTWEEGRERVTVGELWAVEGGALVSQGGSLRDWEWSCD